MTYLLETTTTPGTLEFMGTWKKQENASLQITTIRWLPPHHSYISHDLSLGNYYNPRYSGVHGNLEETKLKTELIWLWCYTCKQKQYGALGKEHRDVLLVHFDIYCPVCIPHTSLKTLYTIINPIIATYHQFVPYLLRLLYGNSYIKGYELQ